MTVYHNRDQGDRSNVQYAGGRILAYDKKHRTASMEHIDYGLGVFRARALESYVTGKCLDLVEIYQRLLATGRLGGYEIPERFFEIGSPAGIKELERHLATNKSF
jgi:N-acetyl-alpha-D-muramate 1-phosphate uridylyltransferase